MAERSGLDALLNRDTPDGHGVPGLTPSASAQGGGPAATAGHDVPPAAAQVYVSGHQVASGDNLNVVVGPHGAARADAATRAATAPGAEQVTGTGHHAASAGISGAGSGTGSYPVTVHRNANGSLDVTIPKGPGHPESVRIHVDAGTG